MKARRGNTLIEVLVSIAVFSIITLSLFSSYLGFKKMAARQEEIYRFSSICRDIAVYGDEYGKEWDKYYFGLESSSESGAIRYTEGFEPTADAEAYILTYSYNDGGELVISIFADGGERAVIKDLNYGDKRYAETEDTPDPPENPESPESPETPEDQQTP